MNAAFFGLIEKTRLRTTVFGWVIASSFVYVDVFAAGDIHIDLHKNAEVGLADVTFDAVADISGSDLPTVMKLKQLRFGAIQNIGGTVVLTRRDIENWMRTQTGIPAARIAWNGSEMVDVKAVGQTVQATDLSKLARSALETWLKKTASNVSITEIVASQEWTFPRGRIEYRIRPFPEKMTATKTMNVWVEVWSDNSFVKVVSVGFEVSVFRSVWVIKNKMNTGSRLYSDACELRDIDVTSVSDPSTLRRRDDPIIANGAGMRVRRNLEAGDALSKVNSEVFPTLIRGETATLHLNTGTVRLESKVEVLEDGFIGQMVHVKNSGSVHQILARIVGPGIVEVQ